MFCKNCGAQMPDNAKFCPKCGEKFAEKATATETVATATAQPTQPTYQQVQSTYQQAQPVYRTEMTKEELPEKYKPLSAWGYFGLQILFSIPIVGFIFLIIFTFNGSNINRRSFARSYWCQLILVAVLFLIFLIIGYGMGGMDTLFNELF